MNNVENKMVLTKGFSNFHKLLVFITAISLLYCGLYVYQKPDKPQRCFNCNQIKVKSQDLGLQAQNHITPCYKWIINSEVYQYSAYFMYKNSTLISIEILFLTNLKLKNKLIRDNFRLVCKQIKKDKKAEIELKVNEIVTLSGTAKKVVFTELNRTDFSFNDAAVALIDLTNYHKQETDKSRLSWKRINYQQPRVVQLPDSKKPEIGHCMNFLHNIGQHDIDKLIYWIKLQKSFGINKIILYDSTFDSMLIDAVYSIYNKKFVEIRPYKLDYASICDFDPFLKHTNPLEYQILKDNCEHAYYRTFENPVYDSKRQNKHQRINLNDCYATLKNEYEFVSVFDFDEIIYPRSSRIDDYSNLTKQTEMVYACQNQTRTEMCDFKTQNSIYSFTRHLIKQNFNRTSQHLAAVYFQNGLYFAPTLFVQEFIDSLKNIIQKNEDYFARTNVADGQALTVQFKFTIKNGHLFRILPNDLTYLEYLINIYDNVKCLYDKYTPLLDTELDYSYKRIFFLVNEKAGHKGKSIHFTDNSIVINAYSSLKQTNDSFVLNVPENDGISSHLRRDNFILSDDLISPIQAFQVDFEFYRLLIAEYSSFCHYA